MDTQQTPPTHGQLRERYLAKVNALVAADREHLIADITAEYALLVGPNVGPSKDKAA